MKQRFIQVQLKVGTEDRVARTKLLIAVFASEKHSRLNCWIFSLKCFERNRGHNKSYFFFFITNTC